MNFEESLARIAQRPPRSLVEGANPEARRAIPGAVAANSPPTGATAGFATGGDRVLHVTFRLTGGTSTQWRLWLYDAVADAWCIHRGIGSSGTVTLNTTDSPDVSLIEIAGTPRVYVEVLTLVGPPTIDCWLSAT